jgi:hypothetical protein
MAVFFGILPPMSTTTRFEFAGDVQNVSNEAHLQRLLRPATVGQSPVVPAPCVPRLEETLGASNQDLHVANVRAGFVLPGHGVQLGAGCVSLLVPSVEVLEFGADPDA